MSVSLRRSTSRAACAVALVAAVCVVPVLGSTGATAAPPVSCVPTTDNGSTPPAGNGSNNANGNANASTIRVTQANLLSGQSMGRFKGDLCRVFKNQPDFVTYNEVPYRADELLAPAGYALFRTPGKYTGATPVAWRTDRWVAINRGTTTISNKRGRVRGQSVEWGVRYANWVTVRSLDGTKTVSVVAAHLAPKNKITANLMGPSISRLGALVKALSTQGPVFVGGDFNRHYTARDYPREGLTAAGLTPTYDVVGSYLPTGDHHGATIDYIFMRPAALMTVAEQTTTEMWSDHDMLSAVIGLPSRTVGETPISFAPGTTNVNDPTAPTAMPRRAVTRTVKSVLRYAPRGANVRVATTSLSGPGLASELRRAARRGVNVKVVSTSATPTPAERSLVSAFGTRRSAPSWIVFRPGKLRSGPPTTVLVSASGVSSTLAVTANRPMDVTLVNQLARATTSTTSSSYLTRVHWFNALSKR